MKILSLNLNKLNDLTELYDEIHADIYAFQECQLALPERTSINTLNVFRDRIKHQKNLAVFEKLWNDHFPWLTFPENYFDENELTINGIHFILINVHLAGFRSGLRNALMCILLKRLKASDLKDENVILLGDFNAQLVHGKATILEKNGSSFLEKILELGYFEPDGNHTDTATYYDASGFGYTYDHIFIKLIDAKHFQIKTTYYPASIDDWHWLSDHRGIILEIDYKD